jgi:hypothetical protein
MLCRKFSLDVAVGVNICKDNDATSYLGLIKSYDLRVNKIKQRTWSTLIILLDLSIK